MICGKIIFLLIPKILEIKFLKKNLTKNQTVNFYWNNKTVLIY
jgi:hypothetical protein